MIVVLSKLSIFPLVKDYSRPSLIFPKETDVDFSTRLFQVKSNIPSMWDALRLSCWSWEEETNTVIINDPWESLRSLGLVSFNKKVIMRCKRAKGHPNSTSCNVCDTKASGSATKTNFWWRQYTFIFQIYLSHRDSLLRKQVANYDFGKFPLCLLFSLREVPEEQLKQQNSWALQFSKKTMGSNDWEARSPSQMCPICLIL